MAYLEAHIEQCPKLDNAGLDISVVTSIAGMAAFAFATQCHERFLGLGGSETVWNMGALSLKLGVTNVVPAFADLTVEVRDLQQEQIDMLDEVLLTLARECDGRQGVTTVVQIQSDLAPLAIA